MAEIISFRDDPHQSTELLLPWYMGGQLDPEDVAAVEAHLAGCAQCRAALAQEHRLKAEIGHLPINADLGWEKLQRQLAPSRRPHTRERPPLSPLWPKALAAFTGAQMALLAFAVLLFRPMTPPAPYQTLGAPSARNGGDLIILFRPDTTEQELRFALNQAGARLVDGPTAAGAYVLAVDPGRRDAALAALRGRPSIVLAQPIDPGERP